jgi:hypothetical protein
MIVSEKVRQFKRESDKNLREFEQFNPDKQRFIPADFNDSIV